MHFRISDLGVVSGIGYAEDGWPRNGAYRF